MGEYAFFLEQVLHDPDAAESMYKRSINQDSQNSGVLARYAEFLSR